MRRRLRELIVSDAKEERTVFDEQADVGAECADK